jgi:hypothetical protein
MNPPLTQMSEEIPCRSTLLKLLTWLHRNYCPRNYGCIATTSKVGPLLLRLAKTFNFLAPKSILNVTASEVCCAANDLISTYKFDLCSKFETPEDYANDLTQEILSYGFCFKEELLGMNDILRK